MADGTTPAFSLAYRLCELAQAEQTIACADEALALRRRLEAREPQAYGAAVAMTLAFRASAHRRSGDLPAACADITAALDQLLRAARALGTALGRQAGEIGGRAVLWHREAGLVPNQKALDELAALTGVAEFGEIT